MEIVKQNMRRQESEMNDLLNRIVQIEEENKKYKEKESKGIEQQLRTAIVELEDRLVEKNKVCFCWEDCLMFFLFIDFGGSLIHFMIVLKTQICLLAIF